MAGEGIFGAEVAEHRAALLSFLVPGIVHSLNNDLFAVRGYAQLIGMDPNSVPHEREAIVKAADKATAGVDVLRVLGVGISGDAVVTEPKPTQAGQLVPRVCDLLRAPMRDRGLRVVARHRSKESPATVEAVASTVAMAEVARAVVTEIPASFRGTVGFDLAHQASAGASIMVAIEPGRDFLPFPVDHERIVRGAHRLVAAAGCKLHRMSDADGTSLVLTIPGIGAVGERGAVRVPATGGGSPS